MTKEEILTGTTLIVEFLGGKYVGKERMGGIDYDMFDLPESFPIKLSDADMFGMKRTGYTAFHESFDWIMPVVEKIEEIHHPVEYHYINVRISQGYIEIEGANKRIYRNTSVEGSKIKALWLAVIDFIKWYNENKQP
jgi:hypothetical protein